MPSIKEYNVKLKSLKNTEKITKTMKMVSASKLRRAQDAQINSKMYANCITGVLSRVTDSIDSNLHPLLHNHERVPHRALILVYTSDKGLCGAFNNNAFKQVLFWLDKHEKNYKEIQLSFCGKRGYNFFKKRLKVRSHYDNITINPDFETAKVIGQEMIDAYIKGEIDEVYLVYNQFISPLSQKTIYEKVLPIDPDALKSTPEEDSEKTDLIKKEYLFEPEAKNFLEYLIPHFLFFKIYFALLENSAGEHGSRMAAMDSASKNASDLIDKNTLLRNRARQAQITTELTEIVAGAGALE